MASTDPLSPTRETALEARCAHLQIALQNLVNVLGTQVDLTQILWDGALEPYLSGRAELAAARAVLADVEGQDAAEQWRIFEGYRAEAFTLAQFVHYWLGTPERRDRRPFLEEEVQQALVAMADLTQQENALWEVQQARTQAEEDA